MGRFKYLFLVNSIILTFMGAMLKLDGYGNYKNSMIAGTISMFVFIFFLVIEAKRENKQFNHQG